MKVYNLVILYLYNDTLNNIPFPSISVAGVNRPLVSPVLDMAFEAFGSGSTSPSSPDMLVGGAVSTGRGPVYVKEIKRVW